MNRYTIAYCLVALLVFPPAFSAQTGWQSQTTPTLRHLYSVAFLDRNTGYAAGQASVVVTHDGGNTWTDQTIPTKQKLYSISLTDASHMMIAGRDGTILRTTNAGANWQLIQSEASKVMPLKCSAFTDSLHGWMAGWYGTIIYTTNGGKDWVKQKTPTNVFINKMIALDAKTAIGVAESGVILRTTNQGNTWQIMPSGVTDSLYGISASGKNKRILWAVGDYGTILRSTNGGSTWECSFSPTKAELLDVTFCDEQHGTIVGANGTIIRTDDGGEHWILQGSPVASHLNSVAMIDPKTITIVGVNGTVLHTTDGGWGKK